MSMSLPEIRQGNGRPHTDRVKARHGARRRRVASCLEVLEDRTLLATVNLSIVNTVLPVQVNPGGQLTYTIAATNNDATTDAAAGVKVSDTFTPAADAAFGTLTPPTGWTDVVTNNTVTFTSANPFTAGSTVDFTIPVTVGASVASGTDLVNTASITPATGDTNSNQNNTSMVTTPVVAAEAPTITSAAATVVRHRQRRHVHGDDHRNPDRGADRERGSTRGVTFVDNRDGTATLAGTPAAGTADTYPLTITAANGTTPDATQSFTLTVPPPRPRRSPAPTPRLHGGHGGHVHGDDHRNPDRGADRDGALRWRDVRGQRRRHRHTRRHSRRGHRRHPYALTITAANGTPPTPPRASR